MFALDVPFLPIPKDYEAAEGYQPQFVWAFPNGTRVANGSKLTRERVSRPYKSPCVKHIARFRAQANTAQSADQEDTPRSSQPTVNWHCLVAA